MGKFNQEHSENLVYLRECFNETMRMESPLPYSAPSCFDEDVAMEGIDWKACTDRFVIAFDYLHHDPVQWQEPWKFIPERFDPESKFFKRPDGGVRHPFSFGPFLGGQRICMGKTFAELMVRFTISIIMYHFELKMCDKSQIHNKPKMNISGQCEPRIMFKMTKRNAL
jgi:thromboxane-A synthase/cytochrome P450 family 3 subfamily A